jgi:hypothetical protein
MTSLCALLFSPAAFSCFCVPDQCPRLGDKAGPVFLGTVLEVVDLSGTGYPVFLPIRKARIQVDESFGGLPDGVREVDVFTSLGGGDCGIRFLPGKVYLIAGSVGKNGFVHATVCGSTRVDAAGIALRVLRQRRDGQPVPSLIGRIAQHDRDLRGRSGQRDPKILANTTVRVMTDAAVYETLSNAEGYYEFYDLPSGQYQFAPELPPGTTLAGSIGSDEPLLPFGLEAGACKESNIEVFASGSVQGRVLDSSNMLAPAFVYIVPVDEKVLPQERQLHWASQGKKGFFQFIHIPPGRYSLVLNPDDTQNPEFPYRRTFYPGVHERVSAGIINIRAGEQIKGADIRLGQRFAPRHLTVRVTWADGQLIQGPVLVEAEGTDNPAAQAQTSQPDPKASVIELSIVANESYTIKAKLVCQYEDAVSEGPGKTLEANPAYIGASDNRTEVALIIPVTGCPKVAGKTLVLLKD